MSSIGVVAAGVAHEINNPLTYLLGNLELLVGMLQKAERNGDAVDTRMARSLAEPALDGAERVRTIVRDLKTFSRPDRDELEAVDLREVLDAVLRIAGHELKHHAQVTVQYGDLPKVLGNSARLSQVFMNVVTNAAQAMSGGSPERSLLHVRARAVSPEFVEIELADSGPGMDEATLNRAFELFYTTKHGGTGLGLALSRKIVEGFGGSIAIDSKLGVGTKVTIRLRSHEGPSPRVSRRPDDRRDGERRRRVLVVDDENSIRDTVRVMIEHEFDVELARSGREALDKLTHASFDAVLCDVMMTQMSGAELYEAVRKRDPELAARFVFMTGGACTAATAEFLRDRAAHVLEKPFTSTELRKAILRKTSA